MLELKVHSHTLDDVNGDAHALGVGEAGAHGGVQVARAPRRHQQHAGRAARAPLHHGAVHGYDTRMRRDAPAGRTPINPLVVST